MQIEFVPYRNGWITQDRGGVYFFNYLNRITNEKSNISIGSELCINSYHETFSIPVLKNEQIWLDT